MNFSPQIATSKEVILQKIDIETKAKSMKLKRKEILKEEKKNCCEDELENSKNSVNNLQKSFRIRNQRSLSELRENNEKFNNVAKKKQEIVQQKLNMITNFTNKHLIHNKMQKRPDTTGAKNREKKYVIVEKNDKNQQKINQEFIKEKVSTQNLNIPDSIKDKFKEDFIEKMRNEQETHSIINNHPLDIKKEFSTDLFDEFKFGELLGEGFFIINLKNVDIYKKILIWPYAPFCNDVFLNSNFIFE